MVGATWRTQNEMAHAAVRNWRQKSGWTFEDMHLALRIMGLSASLSSFIEWAGDPDPANLIGSKIVINLTRSVSPGTTFAEWKERFVPSGANSAADILERREAIERDRRERAARFLAMEHRGGGPGRKPVSDLDGLDAETIRALSGGTIYTPRAKDGYGYA